MMLANAMRHLLQHQPFYAAVLSQCRFSISDRISTASVTFEQRPKITINPKFWAQFSKEQQAAVLMHECLHLMLAHKDRSEGISKEYFRLFNVAADIALNQLISNIPQKFEGGCSATIENFKEQFPEMEEGRTTEYYFEFLKPHCQTIDLSTMDEHSDLSQFTPEQQAVLKQMIKRAKEFGSVPGELREIIKDLTSSTISWQRVLRQFVAQALNINPEASRKVRNRRYGLLQPGIKKRPKLRLAVAVDTSGSMDQEMIRKVFSEIKEMYGEVVELLVIECDCRIGRIYTYDPKTEIRCTGGGGTSFLPVFEALKEMEVEGLIYFTDGYNGSEDIQKPGIPVLWALSENHGLNYTWGRRIVF